MLHGPGLQSLVMTAGMLGTMRGHFTMVSGFVVVSERSILYYGASLYCVLRAHRLSLSLKYARFSQMQVVTSFEDG